MRAPRFPFGPCKGKCVSEASTAYLCFLTTCSYRTYIHVLFPDLFSAVWRELAERLQVRVLEAEMHREERIRTRRAKLRVVPSPKRKEAPRRRKAST